jgi:hypothetical protein
MHALKDEMLVHRNTLGPVLRWSSPGEKDDTIRAYFRYRVNDFLGQQLPALAGMRVCLALANSKAGVEE